MSHISLTYHIIWRTKCSKKAINENHETDLYRYIFGICKNKNCKLFRINSMPDHIHICTEIAPTIAISDFMKVLKQETSKWMKEHKEWFPNFEAWGNGYAVFSYSTKERQSVIEYIKNQKAHHHKATFREEYEMVLKEFGLNPATDLFLRD